MNDSKLINLLRTFSKSEMKEFEKLVSSTFFNKGRNYLPYLNELKKFYPKFDDEKLTQEYVFSKLYKGKKFNKQIMWNMSSALFNMAEEFLINVALKTNSFVRNNLAAEEYHDRKLIQLYLKTIDNMENRIERLGIEENYFMYNIQLAIIRKAYFFLLDAQHMTQDYIMKKGEYTILYFLKNLGGFICDMKANELLFNKKFDVNMPEEFLKNVNFENIIKYVKEKNYTYAWIMEMYYCLIMLILNSENTRYFFRLKDLFEQNYSKFGHEERYNWIVPLTNYCVMKINKGIDFKRHLFEMNELNLKSGIVFPRKYLTKILFLRILRNALSVNETEWGKKYIEEYVPKLSPSLQKHIRSFSYGMLYFTLKNYDKVLGNLAKVEFVDGRDKLHAKTLYLKTYYELNDIETLFLHIDSARHFVNKNSSISEITKKTTLNFLNVLNKLTNMKINGNISENIDELSRIIDQNRPMENFEWLGEKIEEIKSKSSVNK